MAIRDEYTRAANFRKAVCVCHDSRSMERAIDQTAIGLKRASSGSSGLCVISYSIDIKSNSL